MKHLNVTNVFLVILLSSTSFATASTRATEAEDGLSAIIEVLSRLSDAPFGLDTCVDGYVYSSRGFANAINKRLPCARMTYKEVEQFVGHPLSQTVNLPDPCANVLDLANFVDKKCGK